MPTRREKESLKLPRLEKPTSMQTSVTECWPAASSCRARSRRDEGTALENADHDLVRQLRREYHRLNHSLRTAAKQG